jgi:hypothetical protein
MTGFVTKVFFPPRRKLRPDGQKDTFTLIGSTLDS